MNLLTLEIAWRYVVGQKRSMAMSLLGIIFGVAFFIITQAQTTGFEHFFIRTILGTNGAIKISDQFQDMDGTVSHVSKYGKSHFLFRSREDAEYKEGISSPDQIRSALASYQEITGVSEVLEGNAVLSSSNRSSSVQYHGIRHHDHSKVSELDNQLLRGNMEDFIHDPMSIILGNRVAERLMLKKGDRCVLKGGTGSLQLRVAGVFETGVSQIDKKRVYLHLATAKEFKGERFAGSFFQLGLANPQNAPAVAAQLQHHLGHRSVSWQEREKVWLDVFKALRISSAITVSSILLLSGLGIFNIFAIMVIEKARDIAILRSMGFSSFDATSVFLWQGLIVLLLGLVLGCLFGVVGTYIISEIPLKIRGIFATDSFVVRWDILHYFWAVCIASFFVIVASWIPARRAGKIQPAKIIRETL